MKKAIFVMTGLFLLLASGVVQADITDGLVGYYPFESNANDASGNGHNGTLVGDPSFVTGAVGQAIELDGDEDAVDIGTSSAYNLTTFSICAWVNPVTDASGYILGKKGSFSAGIFLEMKFQGAIWIGGHWVQYHSSDSNPRPPIPADQWSHLCVTYGDGAMTFYVDGQQVNSYAITATPDQTSDAVFIGKEYDTSAGNYFEGALDEVRLYNRVLTANEVAGIYSENGGQTGCACTDTDNDGVPDDWDTCPETPAASYVDNQGCPGTQGLYTQEDMDLVVNQMLEWDTDDDGKVGLVEAIRALQISAGINVP